MPIISSHNEMTILVVDESVEDIDFLSEVLCTEYRVITASNGPKRLCNNLESPLGGVPVVGL